jgi:hypothetical protein
VFVMQYIEVLHSIKVSWKYWRVSIHTFLDEWTVIRWILSHTLTIPIIPIFQYSIIQVYTHTLNMKSLVEPFWFLQYFICVVLIHKPSRWIFIHASIIPIIPVLQY